MANHPESGGGERRVLLADDNTAVQVGLGEALRRLGLSPRIVSDGQAALDVMEGGGYAMVFLDLNMPVMNGIDCIREVRRREVEAGSGRMPVIAITGMERAEGKAKCLAAGADDILPKPFDIEKLIAVLERWLPGGYTPPASALVSNEAERESAGQRSSRQASVSPAKIAEIRHLEAKGSPDLLKRMVELYRAASVKYLVAMEQALSARNPEALAGAAHELKSSSGSVGGERLCRLCSDMERLGELGLLDGAEGLLSLIRAEQDVVLGILLKEVNTKED